MRVLVARPAREALSTARRLAARGHVAIIAPVMAIVATGDPLPAGAFDAILATSAHAIELAEPTLASPSGPPLYVVGDGVADAARSRVFGDPRGVEPDAARLVDRVLADFPASARFLYLAGRDRKSHLETRLRAAGHRVDAVEVYAARAETALSSDVAAALRAGEIDAALHFSRRSATLVHDLAGAAGLGEALAAVRHVCISADAAAPLRRPGWRVVVAATPDSEGLFAALDLV